MNPAGSAAITDYPLFSYNCNVGNCKRPYFAPVPTFQDVQLYVNFGTRKPTAVIFTKFDLCGGGTPEVITTDCFLIANNGSYWYGIFKNFSSATIFSSFIISLQVTYVTGPGATFFSEQYKIQDACEDLASLQVCYPTNYNAEDINGIYIGQPSANFPALGNAAIIYQHHYWVRSAEIVEAQNKITYVANWRKNFSTKLNKIFEFRTAELVPGWYKDYILSVFFRGQIFINGVETKISDLLFENTVEEANLWKPWAKIDKELRGAFGCAPITCATTDCDTGGACIPVAIVGTPNMPDAHPGVPYNFIIYLTGTAPFTLSSVVKPIWMTITVVGSTIEFTGTPGTVGNRAVSFNVNNCDNTGHASFSDVVTVNNCSSEIYDPSGVTAGTGFAIDDTQINILTVTTCPRSVCYRYQFTLKPDPIEVTVGTNYELAYLPAFGPVAGGCGPGDFLTIDFNPASGPPDYLYLNQLDLTKLMSGVPTQITYGTTDRITVDLTVCCNTTLPIGNPPPDPPEP